jgi:LysR family transcriptional regulator of beta-lactamase
VLTDEGAALVPVLTAAFDTVSETLDCFIEGRFRQSLNVGVVSTFATGWLIPRLSQLEAMRPDIDLRIHTNNNRVDIAGEGLDLAIRFGDGSWRATEARRLLDVEMTPLCVPDIAARLYSPADLAQERLLRSYRAGE